MVVLGFNLPIWSQSGSTTSSALPILAKLPIFDLPMEPVRFAKLLAHIKQ